jgi:hypothetical protein
MTGAQIAQLAKEHLTQLTGLKADTVSSMSNDAQGWHVSVDLIQLKRLPDATDVLATYEAVLDDEGNLVSYQRTRCYYRGATQEEAA